MAQHYPKQFKRDAVAFYENNLDLTLLEVSDQLGVNRSTLLGWVKAMGKGNRTRGSYRKPQHENTTSETDRIQQLEQENRRLHKELDKVLEERDILRKAAKYFAEETNW